VYENTPGHGFHLLLIDDDGGFVLADEIGDLEAAAWLADLANDALATLRLSHPELFDGEPAV
jgi:hypothetical protein